MLPHRAGLEERQQKVIWELLGAKVMPDLKSLLSTSRTWCVEHSTCLGSHLSLV